jgi:hypothetical protein
MNTLLLKSVEILKNRPLIISVGTGNRFALVERLTFKTETMGDKLKKCAQ